MLTGLIVGIVACGDSGTTTTSAVAPGTTLAAEPTTTLPPAFATPESNALARELKRTAQLAAVLGQQLQDQGVPQDDPRVGLVWALRARGQAVTARKAILEEQLELADNATKELRVQLNRAGAVADAPVADDITKAIAVLTTMQKPSSDPAAAATTLDGLIKQLEPLIAQAQAVVDAASPATTAGT